MKTTSFVTLTAIAAFANSIGAMTPAAAWDGTKAARDCLRDYNRHKTRIAGSDEAKQDFVAACIETRVGAPDRVSAPPPEPAPRNDDYKLGYMLMPAFLSSPQIALPLLSGAGLPPTSRD